MSSKHRVRKTKRQKQQVIRTYIDQITQKTIMSSNVACWNSREIRHTTFPTLTSILTFRLGVVTVNKDNTGNALPAIL